jgi:heptosyltransferase-3
MAWLKGLERLAKYALALAAAALLWRPGRRARALERIAHARKILLVRVDDRVGEALLMTPLLATLRQWSPPPEVHVLLHQRAVRVLEGHPDADRVIGLDRRWLALGAAAPGVRPLRGEGYDVVVDCGNWQAPAVTSALVSRLAGPRSAVVGPAGWPVRALHDVPVDPLTDTLSELRQRVHLLSALSPASPAIRSSFRTPRVSAEFETALPSLAPAGTVVINPGGRLPSRRAPPAVFATAAQRVRAAGRAALITWGPGEEALAREVTNAAPGARLAPPTDLDQLAALMRAAGTVICNNTGPMHLAVACGAATFAFFVGVDPERWGYPDSPHAMVVLTPDAGVSAEVDAFLSRSTRGGSTPP